MVREMSIKLPATPESIRVTRAKDKDINKITRTVIVIRKHYCKIKAWCQQVRKAECVLCIVLVE